MRFAALTAVLLALGLAPLAAMADHVTLAKGVTKKDDRVIVEALVFGQEDAVYVPGWQLRDSPGFGGYRMAGMMVVSPDSDDYDYSRLLSKKLAGLGETIAAEALKPRSIEVSVDGRIIKGVAFPPEMALQLRQGNAARLAEAMPLVAQSPDKFTDAEGQYAYVNGDTLYVRWGENISREAAKKEAAAKA